MVIANVIARAYQPQIPLEMVGLPAWAREDRYDIAATSTLTVATRSDRIAMLRALLADRFNLVTHVAKREHPVYELVLARSDGRLGPGLKAADVDCNAVSAERDAAVDAAMAAGTPPPPPVRVPPEGPIPPCTVRLAFTKMEAQATMPNLALAFWRMATSPTQVVDRTGLTGTYVVSLEFDPVATRRPDVTPPTGNGPPTLFTAIQEQLGLKLVPTRALLDTLVIDRLEGPTEN